ncbi:DedA family protein [Paenibacillus doosanensis]|uniref:Inner membrane protein YghB n=1 Tax=Paenibacillus konkukensis TaxID=2020716 RepID=A0ABY4RY72_9BACL|nr:MULTISPECIES: DedA family protein [Paenibacillus]MCS7458979.1 DedA family protein [Paenibacillus doosanensis]UQZ86488.1 Inner membrane protein YghB [Paenibacillus konkukensis]
MSYDSLLSMIGQFGYAALFFALWLGIVGMPIPDEVIVMTGGAATASGLLHVIPAFALTYLGVISGLSLGYFLGRFVGSPVIEKLKRKKKMDKYLSMSESLIEKYGSMALVISYFFPVVRHVTPYIVGINKMTFRRYALISYSTGLVWTLIFFVAGRLAGDHVEEAGKLIHLYGLRLLWVPAALVMIWAVYRLVFSKRSLGGE